MDCLNSKYFLLTFLEAAAISVAEIPRASVPSLSVYGNVCIAVGAGVVQVPSDYNHLILQHWKGQTRTSVFMNIFNQPFAFILTRQEVNEGGQLTSHYLTRWSQKGWQCEKLTSGTDKKWRNNFSRYQCVSNALR